MSPSDFAKLTLRNLLTITISVALGLLGAFAVYLMQKPTYVADATAYVKAINPDGGTDSSYTGTLLAKQKVKSFIPVFTSRTTAEGAINNLQLSLRPEQVVQRIQVTAPTDSVAINVRASGGSPTDARDLANAIVNSAAAEIQLLEGGPNAAVRVVPLASAALPTSPASPVLSRYLLVGLLLGFLVGYLLAFIRYRMDTRIRNVADIEEGEGAVVLGTLPADRRIGRKSTEQSEHEAKTSFMGREALRKLRTNLRFVSIDNPPRAIVITSSQPKDGKSTVALRLAQVIAASGTRVLLVDADLRRPTVAKTLNIDGSAGLSGILTGDVFLDEAVQQTEDSHLYVLPAGRIPPNPSELLGSKRMRDLLEVLRSEYQYVIIDAPPLLQVTDGALLAASADGAIAVVNAGVTRKSELNAAIRHLKSVDAAILGTVLNRVSVKRMSKIINGHDGYGYGYGYGYSSRYENVVATTESKQPAVENVPFLSPKASRPELEQPSRHGAHGVDVRSTLSAPLQRPQTAAIGSGAVASQAAPEQPAAEASSNAAEHTQTSRGSHGAQDAPAAPAYDAQPAQHSDAELAQRSWRAEHEDAREDASKQTSVSSTSAGTDSRNSSLPSDAPRAMLAEQLARDLDVELPRKSADHEYSQVDSSADAHATESSKASDAGGAESNDPQTSEFAAVSPAAEHAASGSSEEASQYGQDEPTEHADAHGTIDSDEAALLAREISKEIAGTDAVAPESQREEASGERASDEERPDDRA